MNIESLYFENYRNLENSEIFPSAGVNVIYGDNAQGKTNLLELMWLFTGGKSFRGAKDRELIKFDKKFSKISTGFYSNERLQNIKIEYSLSNFDMKKNIYLNDVYKKSSSLLIGKYCGVVFSPVHLSLVKNAPSLRRKFVDAAICQTEPSYPMYLVKYKNILAQRNSLLKNVQHSSDYINAQLDIWDSQLDDIYKQILKRRVKYCIKLQKYTDSIYKKLFGDTESININYITSYKYNFLSEILEKRETDIKRGYTSIGAQRDDIDIKINGLSAKIFASQGQQRFTVLALKLAEAKILEEVIGEAPMIFFDDVLSELDSKRQRFLLENISSSQVFITCCEINEQIKNSGAKFFRIKAGKISD